MKKKMLLCGFLLAGAVSALHVRIQGVVYDIPDDKLQEFRQGVQSKIAALKTQADESSDRAVIVACCNELVECEDVLRQLAPSGSYQVLDYGDELPQ